MTQTPHKIYKERLDAGDLRKDLEQAACVQILQDLFCLVMEREFAPKLSFLQRMAGLTQEKLPPLGIYMYGGVGRGKSMLMDLFYDCLPDGISKRRVHFHEFMVEIHDYIHALRQKDHDQGSVDQALPLLAAKIASEANILCFDEFHVTDIADAMILGRLFKILFEHDVIVISTSNWAPDDLYKDGLQRERFLPFIDLLKSKVQTIHLDSPHDYRAQSVQIEGTYFYPLGRGVRKRMDEIFGMLSGCEPPEISIINVKGREIISEQSAQGAARFSFAQLCERPHGAEDYLAIAQKYHTVFLEGVPKLGYDRRNEAKRLMALIDALYEARVRVIISAATKIEKLYVDGDHAYEFERTISRLLEMQSDGYP